MMNGCVPADVRWTVETDGVVLCREPDGYSRKLEYPQAALWDFLVHRNTIEEMLPKLALVAGLSWEEAELLLSETMQELQQEGFLQTD